MRFSGKKQANLRFGTYSITYAALWNVSPKAWIAVSVYIVKAIFQNPLAMSWNSEADAEWSIQTVG